MANICPRCKEELKWYQAISVNKQKIKIHTKCLIANQKEEKEQEKKKEVAKDGEIEFKMSVYYNGGHILYPVSSSRTSDGVKGELQLRKNSIIFLKKSGNKEEIKIEIPIIKIIKKDLRCEEGSAKNIQDTAAMTAALGPWGLIAGMTKKVVLFIPFKDPKGFIQRPIFSAINGSQKKDLTKFNQLLYNKI